MSVADKFRNMTQELRGRAKQKTAYEIVACLVGSEMCIRDRVKGDLKQAGEKIKDAMRRRRTPR